MCPAGEERSTERFVQSRLFRAETLRKSTDNRNSMSSATRRRSSNCYCGEWYRQSLGRKWVWQLSPLSGHHTTPSMFNQPFALVPYCDSENNIISSAWKTVWCTLCAQGNQSSVNSLCDGNVNGVPVALSIGCCLLKTHLVVVHTILAALLHCACRYRVGRCGLTYLSPTRIVVTLSPFAASLHLLILIKNCQLMCNHTFLPEQTESRQLKATH